MTPTGEKASRVLLVEFLSVDRFSQYRSELFPFIRGRAAALGHPVRWLAFGFDPTLLLSGKYRMALSAAEKAALVEILSEWRPARVLLNEDLEPSLFQTLEAASAPAHLDFHQLRGGPDLAMLSRVDAWLRGEDATRALDVEAPRYLVDEAEPDYACELMNPLARQVKPYVQVLGGPTCLYHRPLANNPSFEDVDLSRSPIRVGCSFCGVGDDRRYHYTSDPVTLALRQIRAAEASSPPDRLGREYVFTSALAFMKMRPIMEAILDADLPPSSFLFSCRIDELRRKRHHIEALLPRVAAAGHSLDIANMGVENFAAAENERFNKGISTEDVETTHAAILDWEARFPETFHFHAHGGYGFILFTPWTAFDDLRENLRWAEKLHIVPRSFFFASRVQLLPDRPLTLLAERDGLLVDRFDDDGVSAFDSGCIVSDEDYELPWRFQLPSMAAVYTIFFLSRLIDLDEPLPEHPLAPQLAHLLARLPVEARSPYRLLPRVVDAAEAAELADRAVPSAAALLTLVEDALADQLAQGEAQEEEEERGLRDVVGERVALVLDRLRGHPKAPLRGFIPGEVVAQEHGDGWGQVVFTLTRGDERLEIYLRSREPGRRAFMETGHFALFHARETPVRSVDQQRVVRVVARAVERYVAALMGRDEPVRSRTPSR